MKTGVLEVINVGHLEGNVAQRDPPPGRAEVNLASLVMDYRAARHLFGDGRHHLLAESHHFLVIPVGGVELELREFWVVFL